MIWNPSSWHKSSIDPEIQTTRRTKTGRSTEKWKIKNHILLSGFVRTRRILNRKPRNYTKKKKKKKEEVDSPCHILQELSWRRWSEIAIEEETHLREKGKDRIGASVCLSFGFWSTTLSFSEECEGKEESNPKSQLCLVWAGKLIPWFGGGSCARP